MSATLSSQLTQDLRSLVSFFLCLVVLYGFGVVDEVLRRLLARSLSEALETEVRVGFLSVWLVSGRVEIDKATVTTWHGRGFKNDDTKTENRPSEKDVVDKKEAVNQDTVQVGKVHIWCDAGRALWSRIVRVEKMRIYHLKLRLIRRKDGTLNVEFFARPKRQSDTYTPDMDSNQEDNDDDWINVIKPTVTSPSSCSSGSTPTAAKRAQKLWSLVTTAASDAEQRLRTRRDEPGKSMFEDAALLALDAAQVAKAEVDRSTEHAKRWAKDTARQGLEEALKSLFDRAEKTAPQQADPKHHIDVDKSPHSKPCKIKILFDNQAQVQVDTFVLELTNSRGIQLIEPPLIFQQRILDAANVNPDRQPLEPGRAIVRLIRLLVQACLEDLFESRPSDAIRLAKVVANNITHSAKRAAKTKVAIIAKSFGVDRSLFQGTSDSYLSFTDRSDDDDHELSAQLVPDDLASTTF
uniref:Uncharacterized protein n=1 Tax=Aureoumbra lagunensis TaxID=44058 RepID=A0A7S3K153_9STRA|mmetsp:Transcript_21075/g.27316  ORF Transcript_21075/g.27316 Transcript_21075/m.27316 type:complete len:465 (+) Transcript_21075:60-1454(+)